MDRDHLDLGVNEMKERTKGFIVGGLFATLVLVAVACSPKTAATEAPDYRQIASIGRYTTLYKHYDLEEGTVCYIAESRNVTGSSVSVAVNCWPLTALK
jgi:hypothetical protein